MKNPAKVEAGMIVDHTGEILVVTTARFVGNQIVLYCRRDTSSAYADSYVLLARDAKGVDFDLYPKSLEASFAEFQSSLRASERFLRRLAEGKFEVDWKVAGGHRQTLVGVESVGDSALLADQQSQRHYFVHGVSGWWFSKDECREQVQQKAQKALEEFERLVGKGEPEAALTAACSIS